MLKIDQQRVGFVVLHGVGTSRRRFEKSLQSWVALQQHEGRPIDYRGHYELIDSGCLAVGIVFWGLDIAYWRWVNFAESNEATLVHYVTYGPLEVANVEST